MMTRRGLFKLLAWLCAARVVPKSAIRIDPGMRPETFTGLRFSGQPVVWDECFKLIGNIKVSSPRAKAVLTLED